MGGHWLYAWHSNTKINLRSKKMDIGSKVFVLDTETKKVFGGELTGKLIRDTGYLLLKIANAKGIEKLYDKNFVHDTKLQADNFAKFALPIVAQMEAKNEEANKSLNKWRALLIGDPEFVELAEKVKEGGK